MTLSDILLSLYYYIMSHLNFFVFGNYAYTFYRLGEQKSLQLLKQNLNLITWDNITLSSQAVLANCGLVSLELFSFYVDKRATVLAWLKQNRRRRVIVGAAFSDELQRRFVEEIPRLRLDDEGLCDLLRALHNARRYRVHSF